ncbi:homeobox protein DLX-5-like [Leguminivora glycinivorella]|uniref:homeobox protein DLX-5-like n=1 Tax=Leguminivora glycinivorella TaxID=1035111 RepID=UPI00200DE5FF|nr:homeobox protein DLX-5-like [Leguminivora glycinivorella]
MFQDLVMDGLTPLCNTNEIKNWDNRPFNGMWPESQRSCVRGSEVKRTIRKKPKRVRTAYSTDQLRALEKIYSTTKYIDAKKRRELASTLNIEDKALKIWFQNRRMKEKRESSESSCDTSSENVSCQSPNSPVQANECLEQNVNTNIPYQNGVSYEPDQYQFPAFYYQDSTAEYYQNGYNGYGYEPQSPSFGVDTCVYPTQYYSVYNQYNNEEFNAYEYNQAQNAEMDNWLAKSYDFNCYNLQQA